MGLVRFRSLTVLPLTLVAENGQEICVALDAKSGKEIWRTALDSTDYESGGGNAGAAGNKGGDGPRSTPSSDGKNVYVYDAHMNLYCLDAKTGKEVWKHDIAGEFSGRNIKWKNATSPYVDGKAVHISGGGAGQSFLAFDKNSGALLWKSGDDTMTHATPALTKLNGQDQLIYFMQSGLVSLNPTTGSELWRTDFDFRTSSAASPVVSGNLVYCSAGYSVGAGLFSIGGGNSVKQEWVKSNKLQNHWSTPVVHDGHLYGIYEFKKYGRNPLKCVELATGEIKWEQRGFGQGNCIMVGDKLVVLSDYGDVAIVEVRPDKYSEVARAKVLDGKCWSTPAYSDGHLYVRSTQEGVCIKMN